MRKRNIAVIFIIILGICLLSSCGKKQFPVTHQAPFQYDDDNKAIPDSVYNSYNEKNESIKIQEPKTIPEKTETPVSNPVSSEASTTTKLPFEDNQKNEKFCTLSISCNAVFDNIDMLNEEKTPYIPQNGVILEKKTVKINEGDTVFDLLLRETKNSSIHLEFTKPPALNSAYIEGIANLYEFDCGELSGWMYRVNGTFPQYGCSSYTVNPDDNIEWVYTCSYGKDVGGDYMKNNGSTK